MRDTKFYSVEITDFRDCEGTVSNGVIIHVVPDADRENVIENVEHFTGATITNKRRHCPSGGRQTIAYDMKIDGAMGVVSTIFFNEKEPTAETVSPEEIMLTDSITRNWSCEEIMRQEG